MKTKLLNLEETIIALSECPIRVVEKKYGTILNENILSVELLEIYYKNKWRTLARIDEEYECCTSICTNNINRYIEICLQYGVGAYLDETHFMVIDRENDDSSRSF